MAGRPTGGGARSWALAAAAGSTLWLAGWPAWVLVAGALGSVAWRRLAARRARRRADLVAAELPDALAALAAALRAGRALSQALVEVTRDCAGPLGDELAGVVRAAGLGRPLEEGLDAMLARVPGEDVRLAVVALGLGRGLGGDLADLLDRVVETIRERQRVAERLSVLTSQGRAQAVVLMLLPLALAVAVYALDPDYLRPLVETSTGRAALVTTGALQAAGALLIRRIVAVER
jgi:tight adherence protein B